MSEMYDVLMMNRFSVFEQLRNADAIKAHWGRDIQYERTCKLTEVALS